MTPTTYSSSKVRRSILQDIPESKEIEVVSTPKTPRKTKVIFKYFNTYLFIYNLLIFS